jgi:polyisoprenoid-binding protein YceI
MVAKYLRVSLVALTILGMSTGAFPQNATRPIPRKQAVITFVPERSRIDFTLSGFPHITHGSFKLASGIVRIDPATERMDGEIAINADSGDTGGGMRDREMKNSVLEVDRYPRISFAPQKIESHGNPQGTFPVRVRGVLLIHGGEHEFPIDATVSVRGDVVTINSRFTVPYVAWGLRDPSIFVFRVNKTVDLDVTLVGRVAWAMPTAARIDTLR